MSGIVGDAFRQGRRRVVVVARTGGVFRTFGPYVAAMGEDGTVAFQADLVRGGSGVYAVRPGGPPQPVLELTPGQGRVVSHPDLMVEGSAFCYVERDGRTDLVGDRGQGWQRLASGCGPLGPTVDGRGMVGFRTTGADGGQGVWVMDREAIEIDRSGDGAVGFEGLPVAAGDAVVYRVTLASGGHEIRMWDRAATRVVAATGDGLESLGRFPAMSADRRVVFAARARDGVDGLYAWADGRVERIVDGSRFESIRGGQIGDSGTVLVIGTPRGGTLGVYADAAGTAPVVAIGMEMDGSVVDEFAVNPVSVNARDEVAIRARLADGREVIAVSERCDPARGEREDRGRDR